MFKRIDKAVKVISEWAVDNNYKISEIKYKLFYFTFKYWHAQMYFYVKLDENEKTKEFILKVGNYWTGLLKNNKEVAIECQLS